MIVITAVSITKIYFHANTINPNEDSKGLQLYAFWWLEKGFGGILLQDFLSSALVRMKQLANYFHM